MSPDDTQPRPGSLLQKVEVRYGAATDVGRVRKVNEDSLVAEPPVFAVADGMGGHAGGDIASGIAASEVKTIAGQNLDAQAGARAVYEALEGAQRRIHEFAMTKRSSGAQKWYAGTTAVVALLVEHEKAPHWLLVNLGDSRVYRLLDGRLEQVSVDHSVVQELVSAGKITADDAATHPDRHVITRALGGPVLAEPDFFLLPVTDVDRLLLCSDGVTGMISDDEIAQLLIDVPDPADAASRIVAAAVEAGGRDNATAVVVEVTDLSLAAADEEAEAGRPGDVRPDDASDPSAGDYSGDYDPERQRMSLHQKLGGLP